MDNLRLPSFGASTAAAVGAAALLCLVLCCFLRRVGSDRGPGPMRLSLGGEQKETGPAARRRSLGLHSTRCDSMASKASKGWLERQLEGDGGGDGAGVDAAARGLCRGAAPLGTIRIGGGPLGRGIGGGPLARRKEEASLRSSAGSMCESFAVCGAGGASPARCGVVGGSTVALQAPPPPPPLPADWRGPAPGSQRGSGSQAGSGRGCLATEGDGGGLRDDLSELDSVRTGECGGWGEERALAAGWAEEDWDSVRCSFGSGAGAAPPPPPWVERTGGVAESGREAVVRALERGASAVREGVAVLRRGGSSYDRVRVGDSGGGGGMEGGL